MTMVKIEDIATWCGQQGERLTPTRRAVLSILRAEKQAMTAYQLLELLQKEQPQAKPPTIYRALDFLQRMGLIHRIDSRNAFIACDDFPHRHDSAFLLCQDCGQVTELNLDEHLKAVMAQAEAESFQVAHATIELRGSCQRCQKTIDKSSLHH